MSSLKHTSTGVASHPSAVVSIANGKDGMEAIAQPGRHEASFAQQSSSIEVHKDQRQQHSGFSTQPLSASSFLPGQGTRQPSSDLPSAGGRTVAPSRGSGPSAGDQTLVSMATMMSSMGPTVTG